MNYRPSSELQRESEQRNANHIRKQAWLARSAKHRYAKDKLTKLNIRGLL